MNGRLVLEMFLADHSARFAAALPTGPIEPAIERTLHDLTELLRVDRCALLGGTLAEGGLVWTVSSSCGVGASPLPAGAFASDFPWAFQCLWGLARPVVIESFDALPDAAARDRASGRRLGLRSWLAIPSSDGEGGTHCLLMESLTRPRVWPSYLADRLPLLVNVFASLLSRKRATDTREQIEARQQDLLESVGAIVWRADALTFQTTFVSKEAEAILGYPVESWLRLPGFWIDHVHPEDRERVLAYSAQATRELRKHDFEYRMLAADGRTVWLRNIVTVRARDGQPFELIGLTTNIDARKRAEFETAHVREQLAHAGRVTLLGELAATIAHELNQPIGAIVSNAETGQMLLARRAGKDGALTAILRDIAHDGQRAGAVLHRVRALLENTDVERRPLDVRQLIDDAVALTNALAVSRQIKCVVDSPDALPAPSGDAVQIEQVLVNLVLNAVEAVTGQPSGRRRVHISATAAGAGVRVSVADTGGGIPDTALPHLFDPFFTTKRTGMGMGLAICRTIVRAHGGDIRVSNNTDGGATVQFTLPGEVRGEDV